MSEINRKKIDFAGFGAGQSATTWIYECLKEHPEIYLLPKDESEFSYFLKDKHSERYLERYYQTLKKAKPNQLLGEFNITYYSRGEKIPRRMEEHNPEMKLIACLRDPIQRAYSNYVHGSSLGEKDWESFEDAISSESGRHLIEVGLYYKHLKKFFEIFPKKQILVLIYENIEQDPVSFIQKIYNFLDVEKTFAPKKADTKIGVGGFKQTRLGKFVHKKITPWLKNNKLGRNIYDSSFIRKYFYRFADSYAENKNKESKKYKIDESTQQNLEDYYKNDIDNLEELINKDLSHWKS